MDVDKTSRGCLILGAGAAIIFLLISAVRTPLASLSLAAGWSQDTLADCLLGMSLLGGMIAFIVWSEKRDRDEKLNPPAPKASPRATVKYEIHWNRLPLTVRAAAILTIVSSLGFTAYNLFLSPQTWFVQITRCLLGLLNSN